MNPPDPIVNSHPPDPGMAPGAESLLTVLNEPQREAVTFPGGSLLVLAGAGSGKTRVITHRIAHLIQAHAIPARRIIAVTFTNKASAEMRERIERLLGEAALGSWIGTFHALCLRILRREAPLIGLDSQFVIYDTDDQLAVVKRILKDEWIEDVGPPRRFLSAISRAKNRLESPAEMERTAFTSAQKERARVYQLYQKALARAQAVDFDDLLIRTLELFDRHPECAARYAENCEHLLVDEYQDTNRPQYLLIRHLTATHGNVCVVGDEDQSIYRFRGAEIRNILEFERDHPGTQVIRLERNYRSSGSIIEASGALIAHNQHRKGKTLWTSNETGDPLELFHAMDDRAEAAWITERLKRYADDLSYEDMAVLYRTNAQSRLLEEYCRRDGIPYQLVGSVRFYDRKEVKDLLAYLRLINTPADPVAFRRVINTPARGIGKTSVAAIEKLASERDVPLLAAATHAVEQRLLASRALKMVGGFLTLIADLSARITDGPVALLEELLRRLDYEAYLQRTYGTQATDRMENIDALVSAAVEHQEESNEASLQSFLDRSALVAGADDVGAQPGVTLMTIHCAKGLEFPVVILAGLEEGLFPHAMSREDDEIEEERRLCYVAMTRAKRHLVLAHAAHRRLQGTLSAGRPSRFLSEIPPKLIRSVNQQKTVPAIDFDFRDSDSAYGSSAARAVPKRRPARPAGPVKIGPETADGFRVGALVTHPSLGAGRIVERQGEGKLLKLTIQFTNCGPRKIMPAYVKLAVQRS
jgi:DNA helicase-2/ATP-dependent DNA helicase PcrA